MGFARPALRFTNDLPDPRALALTASGGSALLIHDRILAGRVPGFRKWASRFSAVYPVAGGEGLKSLDRFPAHMEKILRLTRDFPPGKTTIVVMGGGSVGDFGGFVASVLKRGMRLVQIPSTWLAAIDSAHGGKNALNVGGAKNQMGTVHFASSVVLVRAVLFSQGRERARESLGELAKIALIDGGPWARALERSRESPDSNEKLLWKSLPQAIGAKYKVVARDPFERKRIRQVLNLGHTFGHALEAHHGIPHGTAVAQGMFFSLEWSRERGLIRGSEHERIAGFLRGRFGFSPLHELASYRKIPRSRFLELVRADKKRDSSSTVLEIFVQGFGKTRIESVPVLALAAEAKRQGWVR